MKARGTSACACSPFICPIARSNKASNPHMNKSNDDNRLRARSRECTANEYPWQTLSPLRCRGISPLRPYGAQAAHRYVVADHRRRDLRTNRLHVRTYIGPREVINGIDQQVAKTSPCWRGRRRRGLVVVHRCCYPSQAPNEKLRGESVACWACMMLPDATSHLTADRRLGGSQPGGQAVRPGGQAWPPRRRILNPSILPTMLIVWIGVKIAVTHSRLSRRLQQAYNAGNIVGVFKNVDRASGTSPRRHHGWRHDDWWRRWGVHWLRHGRAGAVSTASMCMRGLLGVRIRGSHDTSTPVTSILIQLMQEVDSPNKTDSLLLPLALLT